MHSDTDPMPALSEWLQIMLAEIARKREELERAREEDVKRESEQGADGARESAESSASAP
jgi:hypothetical protein